MNIESTIDKIKELFWGVLKGQYSPDEEEEVKGHLITALGTLTAYVKTSLPTDEQIEYENQFNQAKNILLKFDGAGPWFREMPEMVDTIYNVITYANMLQIEYQRCKKIDNEELQYLNVKIDSLELKISNIKRKIESFQKRNIYLLESIENLISKEFSTEEIEIISKDINELKTGIKDFSTSISKPVLETNLEMNQKEMRVNKETLADSVVDSDVSVSGSVVDSDVSVSGSVVDSDVSVSGSVADSDVSVSGSVVDSDVSVSGSVADTIMERKKGLDQDDMALIEGIELASQYKIDVPIKKKMESEKETLQKLAKLLSALDSGSDIILSPLTEKLISIGEQGNETDEISVKPTDGVEIETIGQKSIPLETESLKSSDYEDRTTEELVGEKDYEEIHEFRESVARLSSFLEKKQEAGSSTADFISSIKKTIADVKQKQITQEKEKTKLTEIIEQESGEKDEKRPPISETDVENIIEHLELKRNKAKERISKLEQLLSDDKIDEEKWQDLMIKAQEHLLRIEDTLDGYNRFLLKIRE